MKQSILLIAFMWIFGMDAQASSSVNSSIWNLDFSINGSLASLDTLPPLKDRYGNFLTGSGNNVIDLKDPAIVNQTVEYDPETGMYIITEKVGNDFYRPPSYMTFDEYMTWKSQQQQKSYFKQLAGISDGADGISGRLDPIAKFDFKKSLIDRLFGGTTVDIRPQGNIDLRFGVDYSKVDNPIIPIRNRKRTTFDFGMDIRMNVTGKIGEKLTLTTNYNTNAIFDFENQMKIDYKSDLFSEDEILKKIEAGNVSLPLKSNLIQGTQNLFGIKTELQFGKLTLTAILANQKSQRQNIKIENGAEAQEFEIPIDNYDLNKHFLLTHYNRDQFEPALENLPQIKSLFRILKMEVWITNDRNQTDGGVRDIVALADLAEPTELITVNPSAPKYLDINGKPLPDNNANELYAKLQANPESRTIDKVVSAMQDNTFGYKFEQVKDFEKVRARKLSTSEYNMNAQLGFVSLKVNVQPDQVVGVAFEYEYNGRTYTVGELSNQTPQGDSLKVLYVKMLKSSTARTDLKYWDLMMKNFYYLGSSQIQQEDFRLDIFYDDAGKGVKRFLPTSSKKNIPLTRLLNLDALNVQGDPRPDGVFDYVPGLTITTQTGRVMFPVLEPFGSYLDKKLDVATNPADSIYLFKELYSTTQFKAKEFFEKNRYSIKGTYRSTGSSAEISLGAFNVPRNSVRVQAGGVQLTEGADYEVDYNIGKVRILNDAYLQPGQPPINVSFEENTFSAFQQKSMIGLRADYALSKDVNIGATYMHLYEKPYTQKVNVGDDPINNRILGMDFNYTKKAPWLTRMVDKIPLISTKAESSVTVVAEVAALKPGHSKAINQGQNEGIVYIDDFEGSTNSIDLRTPTTNWYLSSVPQKMKDTLGADMIDEGSLLGDLNAGVNRALLNWYRMDFTALDDVNTDDPYERIINKVDIFPNLQVNTGYETSRLYPLELHFQPKKRGPYNFDLPDGTAYSQGVDATSAASGGSLKAPEERWGGIMRPIRNSDFEAANIEFIDFWMMSPYLGTFDNAGNEGVLSIQLGNLSEDILRDSRLFFENGLTEGVQLDRTPWAEVPRTQQITYAFDNNEREKQDVGLDGANDELERTKYANYVAAYSGTAIASKISADPSNDNFVSFRNSQFDGLRAYEKYAGYNGFEGNSKPTDGQVIESSTNYPNTEDLNRDNSLNETEAYFQYDIPINYGGSGLLADTGSENSFVTESIVTDKGDRWYHFKIPLSQYQHAVGGIQDFRSIRFVRMVTYGFEEEVIFRFATLELVRNQWRRYSRNDAACPNAKFEVNEVNIEENSSKQPFNYVLPPGVTREDIIGTVTAGAQQNENSLSMIINNLCSDEERGIFKSLNMDMRVYKRLQLFVHAEALDGVPPDSQQVFIRLGKDFVNNYYEYTVPLTFSDPAQRDPSDLEGYREVVWPAANFIDFPLELLKDVKIQRNRSGSADSLTISDPDKPNNMVTVVGNPNIGRVKTVMIGVRNKDGTTSSMEVWVNELRLSGLEEGGGLAGLARVDLRLADFGSVALSGNYSSIGYGAIDQKLAQRSREQVVQYDLAGNFELGKFLPEKSGVKIPFFAQYSKNIKSPQYDPYDLDVELKDNLESANAAEKKVIKERAQDVTTIKSYNFTNVRKDKTNGKKPKPWDISNFSATYAYSETDRHNPLIENDNLKRYRGGLDYQYATKTKYIKPFKKLIKKDRYLKFLSEFNFNLIPNSFGVSTTMDRSFNKTVYRFAGEDALLNTYYNKNFVWDRDYTLNWNLTKALKFAFNAQTNSVIDEPTEFDTNGNLRPEGYVKDSIWTNIKTLGRIKQYRHNMTLNYDLPFKHIPYMDWVRAKATVSADYSWNAAALNIQELGNVAQNGQVRKINGDLNFTKLYSKSKYLKKVDKSLGGRSSRSSRRNTRSNRKATSQGEEEPSGRKSRKSRRDKKAKKDSKDELNKSETKDVAKAGDDKKDGKAAGSKNNSKSKKGKPKPKKKKKTKKKERQPSKVEAGLVRMLLSVRKGRVVYSERYASVVPGFTPSSKILGQDESFSAPGWDYITGFQPNDAKLNSLARNNWITDDIMLNQPLSRTYAQEFNASITVEPFKDFKIDIDASKDFTRNRTEMFKDTNNLDNVRDIVHALPRTVGSYTISFYNANTIFQKDIVALFHQFEDNRQVISKRLYVNNLEEQGLPIPAVIPQHQIDTGYVEGYGRFQQDVLIPAFLSAYTKKNPNIEQLSFLNTIPRPNWKLNYTGLSKIPMFKALFKSFSLRHGYSSKMTVNAYNTATNYDANDRDKLNENTYSYYSQFEIPDITIREQFNPLIGLDMRMKNDMSLNFSYNKSRNLDLSFIDYKLAETKTTDVTFGFGYTIKNVEIGFLTSKKKKKSRKKAKKKKAKDDKNGKKPAKRGVKKPKAKNLVIKMNFSLRDDVTYNHQLDQNVTIPIRGTNTFSMSPTVDYNINDRLTLQFYFDHRRTNPKTSSSPPTVSTSSGVTLRFNLGK